MSDETGKIEIPTTPDGSSGIVIEPCYANGAHAVRLILVVDGRGHRVTLDPKTMLGVACLIGHVCEAQGRNQNASPPLRMIEGRTAAAASEVTN